MSITREPFGNLPDGRPVEKFRLKSGRLEAEVLSLGGIVSRLQTPDRTGQMGDVCLGFDQLEPYLSNPAYLGALIGRYGNRIAGGRFVLGGQSHQLALNNGPNHLHGGPTGFHLQLWEAEGEQTPAGPSLVLRRTSPSGEEHYPGNLELEVRYTFSDAGEWRIDYTATTDQTTPINLTQHAYFNLAGQGDIMGHRLELLASQFLPVDADLIPLGPAEAVEDSPFDFRQAAFIGANRRPHLQLERAGGYDHNWILDKPSGQLGLAARLYEPSSGRMLETLTTQPGIQFYSGNFLDGEIGRGGRAYTQHSGLCLETQHFPDSPNQPLYPSTLLEPGQRYQQTTIYRFSQQ